MTIINSYDYVVSNFRIPPKEMPSLSTPSQAPSYTSLRAFQKALNHNAMSIISSQTDLGHLSLVITEKKYLKASNQVKFVPPTDPEATEDESTSPMTRSMFDSITSADPTSDTLQAVKTYDFNKQTYLKYLATITALRNLILNSVDNKYICKLEHEDTGYARVTPLQLMTHLWDTYGAIDDADHAKNEENMKQPWTPPEPIDTLFEQLKQGQEFAAKGKEIISDSQLVRWGYQNIKNTGLFNRECEKWRKRTETKTWDDFIDHFNTAYDDYLKYDTSPPTAAEATYTANQVQQILHDELSTILGTTAPSDNPPSDSPSLLSNPATANATVTIEDVRRMIQESLATSSSNQSSVNQAYTRGGDPGHRPPRPPLIAQGLVRGKPVSYCWTHGVTSNLRHSSATCRRKATGHKDDATFNDRKGGCESSLVPSE